MRWTFIRIPSLWRWVLRMSLLRASVSCVGERQEFGSSFNVSNSSRASKRLVFQSYKVLQEEKSIWEVSVILSKKCLYECVFYSERFPRYLIWIVEFLKVYYKLQKMCHSNEKIRIILTVILYIQFLVNRNVWNIERVHEHFYSEILETIIIQNMGYICSRWLISFLRILTFLHETLCILSGVHKCDNALNKKNFCKFLRLLDITISIVIKLTK